MTPEGESLLRNRLFWVAALVVGIGLIAVNFYLKNAMGRIYPMTLIVGGGIAGIACLGLVSPNKMVPTEGKENTLVTVMGAVGAACGAVIWFLMKSS